MPAALGHTDADARTTGESLTEAARLMAPGRPTVTHTDSMSATGLPDGDFELGPAAVSVRQSVARLQRNDALAGGTATLLDVVRRAVAAGVPAADAVLSATAVPARVLGLHDEVGSLRAGLRADVVVVDQNFARNLVMRAGRVHGIH